MKPYQILVAAFLMASLGCSKGVSLKGTPVAVTGSVTHSGKPVSNVALSFHPLGDGHLTTVPLNADGSFAGELISGEYSYYVSMTGKANSAEVLRQIDPKYHQADLTRTVTIGPGNPVNVVLD